ncbi:MAG: TULIP family P47-like protein [Bacteroidota bacterium]
MNKLTTNDWDTAFGIRFREANQAIVNHGSSPASFSGSHAKDGGHPVTVQGDFGAWQMSGGSGSILHMSLPLLNGTLKGTEGSGDFQGHATIEVNLGYIPQPGQATTQDLTIDDAKGVRVLNVNLTKGDVEDAKDYIQAVLQDWLSKNLGTFNHVFASVNLNDEDDSGDFAWLKPSQVGYALYTDGAASVDDCLFGVLAMTEGRTNPRLAPIIDPNIIPEGADAGFLIAAPRVVDQMFLPKITYLFQDASLQDFDRRDDGMTIYNVSSLKLNTFTLKGGKKITDATIGPDGFNFSVGEGYVTIRFTKLSFTWSEGYTVDVTYSSVSNLVTDKKGHLQLHDHESPIVSIGINESEAEKWKEIWESIGIDIGVAVLGAVVGGAVEAAIEGVLSKVVAEAAANLSEDGVATINTAVLDSSETAEEEADAEEEAFYDAVESFEEPKKTQRFAGFFKANKFKLLGIAIGAAVGAGIGGVIDALRAYAKEDEENMPKMDGFAEKAMDGTTWPDVEYSLQSVELASALQMGLKKKAS